MKTIIYNLLIIALALSCAVSYSSCDDNDEDDNGSSKTSTELYAKGEVMLIEDLFQIYTANLVLEYDGNTKTYPFDESTKIVDESTMAHLLGVKSYPFRVIEIDKFIYKESPVKAYVKFEITEAGKQKIAEHPDDELNFTCNLALGKCDQNGKYVNSMYEGSEQNLSKGIPIDKFVELVDSHIEIGSFEKIIN